MHLYDQNNDTQILQYTVASQLYLLFCLLGILLSFHCNYATMALYLPGLLYQPVQLAEMIKQSKETELVRQVFKAMLVRSTT